MSMDKRSTRRQRKVKKKEKGPQQVPLAVASDDEDDHVRMARILKEQRDIKAKALKQHRKSVKKFQDPITFA